MFLSSLWNVNQIFAVSALKRFYLVGFDSAWQYFNAMQYTKNSSLHLMLFENMLEEMEHFSAFASVANRLQTKSLVFSCQMRKPLIEDDSGMEYFLAYAHESERSISKQFGNYAKACRSVASAEKVFNSIAIDEVKHQAGAFQGLVSIIGDQRKVRWLIWKVKVSKVYSIWLRWSKYFGGALFFTILFVLFYLFGLFVLTNK